MNDETRNQLTYGIYYRYITKTSLLRTLKFIQVLSFEVVTSKKIIIHKHI